MILTMETSKTTNLKVRESIIIKTVIFTKGAFPEVAKKAKECLELNMVKISMTSTQVTLKMV